jgi:PAS domain S-box-containing protein
MDIRLLNILIIEDNPGDVRLIRELLGEGTLQCRDIAQAGSLKSAVTMLDESEFDVIILDLNLPDSAGIETLEAVRKAHGGNVPIIILTGLKDEAMGESAIGSGAEDYLIKGDVTPSMLSRSIRYAIERKKMELILRESEERYRTIFSNSLDAFFLTEPEGGILYVNPAGCNMFGRTEEEIMSLGRNGIIDTFDPRLIEGLRIRSETGRFSGELTGIRADGTKFPIEVSSIIFKDSAGRSRTSITIRDITERARHERELKESEMFVRSTLDGLSAHIAIVGKNGNILAVNRAWRDFCKENGCNPERAAEGSNYIEVCENARGDDEKTAMAFIEGLKGVLDGSKGSYEIEYPCHSKDVKRWFIARVTPFPGEGPARVVVAHENITERKRIEEDLRESEDMYRTIVGNLPGGIIHIMDRDFRYLYNDGEALQAMDLTHEMLVGKSIHDVLGHDLGTFFEGNYRRVLGGETVRFDGDFKGRSFMLTAAPLMNTNGDIDRILVLSIDVTEKKQAERKIESQLDELRRWHDAILGREERILELKREVNELLRRLGEEDRYGSPE